jgi:hypothetical protein
MHRPMVGRKYRKVSTRNISTYSEKFCHGKTGEHDSEQKDKEFGSFSLQPIQEIGTYGKQGCLNEYKGNM